MTLFQEISQIVSPSSVLVAEADKAYAGIDKTTNIESSLPLLVVKASTTDELVDVARLCLKRKVPVVIRASGTGKSGGAVARNDAVIIDISALNRIISIDKDNLLAEVEPGVILGVFKEEVKRAGLFYPPDPASFEECAIGGNVAENAAGPSTIKYGTTRDYLLGGQVLIGTGELLDFGKRCLKGVAGYDVASLLCGSEGTLGIFTRLILRLLPRPLSFAAAECFFADEKVALESVNILLTRGHRPTTLEYIDHHSLRALYKFLGQSLPEAFRASLVIECDANFDKGARKELESILVSLKGHGLIDVAIAEDDGDRQKVWQRRSKLSEACLGYLGHKISEDIAVPLGRLLELKDGIEALKSPHLTCSLFGHAGDGNLHVQIMFDDAKYLDEAEYLRHQILLLVLKLQGTLTAEHGIGLKKKSYLSLEQSWPQTS